MYLGSKQDPSRFSLGAVADGCRREWMRARARPRLRARARGTTPDKGSVKSFVQDFLETP